ncbi:hypothetical protein [Shinella sp. BYT-45]|uniref:hypothetical protein n=1 Tax=Shinella sp. BYT-45 TaxID=3377377 RepID=UPI0039815936
MTQITSAMLADMHARRQDGESAERIARSYGLKTMTVYQNLRRAGVTAERVGPANDNHPGRVTRMSAYNGGCSTTSGLMPVSVVRIPTIDGHATERVAA